MGALIAAQAVAAPAWAGHGLVVPGDGSLWGWGSNEYGQLAASGPAGSDTPQKLEGMAWRQAAAGGRHSLALSQDGQVWAWGDNSAGQLGLGDSRPRSGRTQVSGLPRIVQVSAGTLHSLALDEAGKLWAWGGNPAGQLGTAPAGLFEWHATPVQLGGLPRIRAIAATGSKSAALAEDGRVFAWGAGVLEPSLAPPVEPGRSLDGNGSGDLTWPPGATGWAAASQPGKAPGGIDASVGILAGRLTRSGKPVAGVRVQAAGRPCAESGQDGRFLCVLPSGGETTLTAYEGGTQIAARTLTSLPGARVTKVDFLLQNGLLPLSGRVQTDARGAYPTAAVHAELPGSAAILPGDAKKPIQEKPALATIPVQARPVVAATMPAAPAAISAQAVAARPTAAERPRPAEVPQASLQISGVVSLAGYEELFRRNLANVTVSAEGGQCSASDAGGRFHCTVPLGWSGRMVARKLNYRFSPSSLAFRGLQEDQPHQDFEATYDPGRN